MTTVTETAGELKTAIDADRTDIICTVISTWKKSPADEELVHHLLNEPQLDCGTLLHYATKGQKTDIVRALLANGANPQVKNSDGKLPLDLASDKIRLVYNEELLQATAQANVGRVLQLLAGGVDINLRDSPATLNTPLHWAVMYSTEEMVQCLAKHGADVNAVNAAGSTPLHDSVRRADMAILTALLNHGADPSITVKGGPDSGKSAFELASGLDKIEQLIKYTPKVAKKPPLVVQNANTNNVSDQDHVSRKDSSASHQDSSASRKDSTTSRQESTTSLENGVADLGLVNGNSADANEEDDLSSPQLKSPSFKPKPHVYDDLMRSPLRPVVTEEKLNLLWPQPQSIIQGGGKPFVIQEHLTVIVAGGPVCSHTKVIAAWECHRGYLDSLGVRLNVHLLSPVSACEQPHVLCHVNSRLCANSSTYKLTISPKQLKIVCGGMDGLRYALCTVLQLLDLYQAEEGISIPTLLVDDSPALQYRGVLLDVSQGRIPNITTLKGMLTILSRLKMNQIHLYTRFKSLNPGDWQLCYTRSEVIDLDNYCDFLGLQLIPVLEVAPKVQFEDVPLLYSAFQDLVNCCSHAEFVSAGPRLSSFLLDANSTSLNVTDASRYLPISRDQTLQLCGYPLHDLSTAILQQLPPHLMFNEYGVKADHDFPSFCRPLADLGISFCVCPGTAAWNSLAGCPEASLCNIFNAVKSTSSQSVLGMVVCNWTGKGHLTHMPFAWPGLLIAAGLAWSTDIHWDFVLSNLADLLNQHVFDDAAQVIGHAVVELGRAETYFIRCARNQSGNDLQNLPDENGSIFYQFLSQPDGIPLEYLGPDVIQRAIRHIKKCQSILPQTNLKCFQAAEVIDEINLTCDFMMLAAKIGRALVLAGKKPNTKDSGYNVVNFGINMLSPTAKTDLANRLLELQEVYKTVWARRYMADRGLQDSLQMLSGLLHQLVPDKSKQELDNLTAAKTENT